MEDSKDPRDLSAFWNTSQSSDLTHKIWSRLVLVPGLDRMAGRAAEFELRTSGLRKSRNLWDMTEAQNAGALIASHAVSAVLACIAILMAKRQLTVRIR